MAKMFWVNFILTTLRQFYRFFASISASICRFQISLISADKSGVRFPGGEFFLACFVWPPFSTSKADVSDWLITGILQHDTTMRMRMLRQMRANECSRSRQDCAGSSDSINTN